MNGLEKVFYTMINAVKTFLIKISKEIPKDVVINWVSISIPHVALWFSSWSFDKRVSH